MRSHILPLTIIFIAKILTFSGCGAKGDPVSHRRAPPASCIAVAVGLRIIDVTLPTMDMQKNRLTGIEAVRVYYLQTGSKYPSPLEVFQHGEPILERHRSELPSPGKTVRLNLSHIGRPSGWLVVVAFRAGNIPGEPSQVLPWLEPSI